MQPLQYDLRDPAAKDKSITNAATARSNLDAAIYIAGTILQLQRTMEFHRQLLHQYHLQSHLHCGNDPRVANHNGILCRPHMDETQLKPHLQCGTDPRPIRDRSENDPRPIQPHTRPSRNRRTARFGDALYMEKHRLSCICYLSKTHFVRDFLQNSIGNSSTSTTCNPIYSEGTILELQITMEFCRPHMDETQLKPHLQCGTDPRPIRDRSEHDPRMIRPHTRPSRTRRTAEVDHRRSGTHFVWKNI